MIRLKSFKWKVEDKITDIKTHFYNKKMKKLYPDYEDNQYNCGSFKFIWGSKSYDDLCAESACFGTMNDIGISYDRQTKLYYLDIETAFMFDGNRKQGECEYLKRLLHIFEKFMDENSYSKDFDICLFMSNPCLDIKADSIERLFAEFKIYVLGYCKFYGFE